MIIYKITNRINNKIYIGQTTRNLNERVSEYKRMKFYNDYLFNAFKKYGFENFSFEIIDSALCIDELNQKEIDWIRYYDSTNKKCGYNIMEGGRNSQLSNETKEKMSKVRKGRTQSKEWIDKRIYKAGSEDAKKYGTSKTNEQKALISKNHAKFWLNKTRDEETKSKISVSKKGQLPSNCKFVFKIHREFNIIFDTYKSTAEAARLNPQYSQSTISRICSGKSRSKMSDNFTFSFTYHG